MGPRSIVTRAEVENALGSLVGDVEAFARADFDDFKVVRNKMDSMWK
jgi:hypothetical protein